MNLPVSTVARAGRSLADWNPSPGGLRLPIMIVTRGFQESSEFNNTGVAPLYLSSFKSFSNSNTSVLNSNIMSFKFKLIRVWILRRVRIYCFYEVRNSNFISQRSETLSKHFSTVQPMTRTTTEINVSRETSLPVSTGIQVF